MTDGGRTECLQCGARVDPDERDDCCGDQDDEDDREPVADGGYVVATGDGYHGTFCVSTGAASINLKPLGFAAGDEVVVTRADDQTLRVAHNAPPADALLVETTLNADGYLELGVTLAREIGVDEGQDVRLYDATPGGVIVPRDDDPRLVADGGQSLEKMVTKLSAVKHSVEPALSDQELATLEDIERCLREFDTAARADIGVQIQAGRSEEYKISSVADMLDAHPFVSSIHYAGSDRDD